MRTTVRLDPALLKAAKRLAAESGRTLTGLIEDGLRETLARRSTARRRESITLPTFRGNGLHPGVDLDDSAGLQRLMDEREA